MSSLNNNNVTANSATNNYFTSATGSNQACTNQDLLKNAMLAANAAGCGTSFASNGAKDSLLQHMATSFMASNPMLSHHHQAQSQVPFPADVFERRNNTLDAATAIAQASSIAHSTAAAPNATASLNAAANLSTASASALLNAGAFSSSSGETSTDLFEPVPLNNAAAATLMGVFSNPTTDSAKSSVQSDAALARMLSKALGEITAGFDSDPIADYNSLYNMDPLQQQQQQAQAQLLQARAQQQSQQQQDLLSQNSAFLQANNNKRSMPTATTPSNKRARTAAAAEPDCKSPRFRPYQEKQWVEQFEELLKFKQERGHCLVPHTFDENPTLSRWVKRQRYQYKLKQEQKQSTMTDARIVQLEQVGFVWDSHAAAWQERLQELAQYKQEFGDCNVPSNYPKNPQLATWVKCQRRQCKLFWCGKSSNMTLDRFASLNQLGFTWELRNGSISKRMAAAALQTNGNLSL